MKLRVSAQSSFPVTIACLRWPANYPFIRQSKFRTHRDILVDYLPNEESVQVSIE